MSPAYTGHQVSYRNLTKGERLDFGQAHAPAVVNPPANRCDVCGDDWVAVRYLTPNHPHVCQPCWDAYAEWDEVLDLVDELDAGYDPTCGLQLIDEWRRDFAFAVLNDRIWCGMPEDPLDDITRDLFGLASIPFDMWVLGEQGRKLDVGWIRNKPGMQYRPQDAAQAAKTAPILNETPTAPVITPQMLQSKEDALEAIAMSKVIPNPARLSELYEAVVFGVEHYENENARIIFDGYYLERSESGTFIHLKHKDHPNRVTVGAADIVTGEMEFVAERADLRDYMARVAAGMKPAGSANLPGVMMQVPIAEEDKQAPLRSGSNQHAEVAPDELPLFAGGDPESAA